ncbi:MAG: hypothetical protein DMG96_37530 [Acidobacteria bacterium]|nr:MAG: hypothetical protein DMG96_37530 [Acidobacteriota bacterium]
MDHNRQILTNTTLLAAARIIDRVSRMLLAFFVARVLHATGLGLYTAAVVYYELIVIAAETGSTTLLVREIGKDRSKTNSYVTHLCLIALVVSAALAASFLGILPLLRFNTEMAGSLRVIALAVIPGVLKTIQEGVFVAHQRLEFAIYTTLVAAIANTGLSLFLLSRGYGVTSLIAVFVIVQYIMMALYVYFINKYIAALEWKVNFAFLIQLAREVRTFAGLAIFAGLFSRPEIVVLSLVSTAAQVGFYSAALRVVNIWQLFPQIYMMNVFPVLSQTYVAGDAEAGRITNRSIKYLLALSLPVMVGVVVAADPILRALYGPGFQASMIPLRLLAVNIPLQALSAVLWRVLVARGRQALVLRALAANTLAELVGDYFLISRWASLGASIISPLIFVSYVIVLAFYARRDGARLRITALGWRFAVASLAMGVLILPLSRHLTLWSLVPLATAAYVGFAFLLRAFSPDDSASPQDFAAESA